LKVENFPKNVLIAHSKHRLYVSFQIPIIRMVICMNSQNRHVNQALIAQEAHVSQSTVSRVLNGGEGVNAAKKKRVLEAMERLGYRPHVLAQGLARGRSMTIGVLTPNISSLFFAEVLGGIEEGLRGSPYYPIFVGADFSNTDNAALEALEVLASRRVDALIILRTDISDEHLCQWAERLPVVVMLRVVKKLEEQCISFDNEMGGYLATKTLIELGHTRIAHISGPQTNHEAIERFAGYRRALQEFRIPFEDKLLFEGDFLEQSGTFAINALLARGRLFTALFAGNDLMACGARLGLHRLGMRVPEDISLIGFDDLRTSRYFIPPLTTIRQPTLEYGLAAARMALRLLEGQVPPTATLFAPELMRRESALTVTGQRRPPLPSL
jgi:LacI family transcriptional regulator